MHTRARHIKGKYSWLKHIDFIVLDLVALIISFIAAYCLKFHNLGFINQVNWKVFLVVSCLLDILIVLFTSPFSGIFRRYGSEELIKTALHATYNFVLSCIFMYVLGLGIAYSRTVVITTYLFYFVLSLIFRIMWKSMLKTGKVVSIGTIQKTIFVVGYRKDMPALLRSINSGFYKEYIVEGICIFDGKIGEKVQARVDLLDSHGRVQETYLEFENQTKPGDIATFILQNNIDEVFIGVEPSAIDEPIYHVLIENGKGIHMDIKPMLGFETDDQFITTVGTHKTLSVGVYSFTGKQLVYLAIKRGIDILFGIIGMVALLPLMAVVKISYLAAGDTKPIFYTQIRVGENGRQFKMYKFRSMVYNADEILQEMLKDEKYKKEWEENQKFEDDPRITKMGAVLRKTSFDEIPQFINVLKGDMSLIGPRPLVVGELELHNGLQLYQQVKPGVTGWWGCNGRSNTTYDERLELEYYYVKNCSLYLDVLCIVKTMAAVLKRDGAK